VSVLLFTVCFVHASQLLTLRFRPPMFKEPKSECPTMEEPCQTLQSSQNLERTSAHHRSAAIHSGAWTEDSCSFMLQDADEEGLAIAMTVTRMAHIARGNIGDLSARNEEQTALYRVYQQDVAAFLHAWTENWDKIGTDESDGKPNDVEEKSNSTSSFSSRVSC
jgi:hypothetical protein